ncbi:MAG: ABC transporter ATP-binding protein [Deltaproteobacteria bacterium]|nr:ABC transporter ATP-binding protein [Deltaproteobacteria bacterium]
MKKTSLPFRETLKHFLPLKEYFVKYRRGLVIGLLSLLAVDCLQLFIPLIIRKAINELTAGSATSNDLLQLGAIIMGIAMTMAVFRYVWRYLLFGISRSIEEGIRNRLYGHLQTLSLSFYHKTKTGDLMARAVNDINAIRMATGMGLVALTDGLVLGLAAIGFMVYINWPLTLISILPAPILIYFTRILTRRMSSGYEKVQAAFSDLTESAREAFAGIRIVKAYTKEAWTYNKMRRNGERYISENMNLAKSIALFSPMMTIFTGIGLAIVIFLGGRLTIIGQITTGDFVAFISYLGLLTWPMMAIGWVTNLVQRGAASMRRLNRILDEVPEIQDTGLKCDGHKIKGKIEIKGVGMAYPGEARQAVKDLHLNIEAGKMVAFVGSVGSGKTTLLHMLPRIYDCPEGAILIDNKNIRDIPLKTLRRNVGFVTQEVFIFSDTIRNNVLLGRTNVTEETVIEALKTAQFWEEVSSLDEGMDALVGERGISLSGGQRQRLSIARALLTNPPILILDDALSMVDTRTEENILNALLTLRKGKTTMIVSHRVSTIRRADLIVVFQEGKIVETGNHDTLLARGMEYARLYQRQLLAQELETQ